MQSRNDQFMFGANFDFSRDNVFLGQNNNWSGSIPPPISGDFDLLDGTNFLLLDGTKFLLL